MSLNMKIEKLCEYLVNFGLLKADDLISFLTKINISEITSIEAFSTIEIIIT